MHFQISLFIHHKKFLLLLGVHLKPIELTALNHASLFNFSLSRAKLLKTNSWTGLFLPCKNLPAGITITTSCGITQVFNIIYTRNGYYYYQILGISDEKQTWVTNELRGLCSRN